MKRIQKKSVFNPFFLKNTFKVYFSNINFKKGKYNLIAGAVFIFNLLLLSFPVPVFGQMTFDTRTFIPDGFNKPRLSDTVVKKRFIRASAELMLAEMTPWLVDRYIREMDYAYISLHTVRYNLKPQSWAWDGDAFTTNQFGHPYHGSLFFSAFRANGYSFWQSAPAAFAGSYLWETFSENQPPAPNDFINTGFGGMILGEMTFRLSNKIINNRRTGLRRQVSEVIALVINPVNGLNRIIDGKWGRISANTAERDSSKIYSEFDTGMRKFRVNRHDGGFGLFAHVKLLYGIPFENYKTPFSNISINAEFGKDDSAKVNIISVYGSLKGWRLSSAKNVRHLFVLSANYDYINNQAFFYSGQSIKLNLFSEFGLMRRLKINTSIGAGPIILSAVPDVYTYEGRDYDYCYGIGFHGNCTFSIINKLTYSLSYRGGWLKSISGNASYYFLHSFVSELRCIITKDISVCAGPGYFTLHGNFKNYNDINKTYPYLRASVRYNINIQ